MVYFSDEFSGGPVNHAMTGDRLLAIVEHWGCRKIDEWHAGPDYRGWDRAEPADYELKLAYWVEKLTYENYTIWHLEDLCRSGVPEQIVRAKPLIDKHNQARNDAIEALDRLIIAHEQPAVPAGTPARLYSVETLGSIIDRLLITRLKWYHTWVLGDQDQHLDRFNLLSAQAQFLAVHAATLLDDIKAGKRHMRSFCQLKLYNSNLNPHWNPEYFA